MTKDKKELILNAWKPRSTADSVRNTHCTRKQNNRKEVSECHMRRKTENSEESWFKGLDREFQKIVWPDKQ